MLFQCAISSTVCSRAFASSELLLNWAMVLSRSKNEMIRQTCSLAEGPGLKALESNPTLIP